MSKIVKKRFYSIVLGATLLANLTACGKEEKIQKEEITTEEITTEVNVSTEEEDIENDFDDLTKEFAKKNYVEYKKIYDDYEIYHEMGVSEYDIIAMINIINGKYEGYTQTEIQNALALSQYVMCPDNLMQLLDNVNAVKAGFKPSDKEFKIYPNSKISEYILNKDIKGIENIIIYENIREKLVDEVATTGTYSEATANEIRKALISQEKEEYDSYKGRMDSSLNDEGIEYLITVAKLSLCNLAQMVTPNSSFIEDENGDKYQISARSDVNEQGYIESDILNKSYQIERDGKELPEDIVIKVAEIESRLVSTKYINGLCTLTDQIKKKAGYTDVSILDFYRQKKALLSLLEERLFYKEIENVLSENSKFEGYNLTL